MFSDPMTVAAALAAVYGMVSAYPTLEKRANVAYTWAGEPWATCIPRVEDLQRAFKPFVEKDGHAAMFYSAGTYPAVQIFQQEQAAAIPPTTWITFNDIWNDQPPVPNGFNTDAWKTLCDEFLIHMNDTAKEKVKRAYNERSSEAFALLANGDSGGDIRVALPVDFDPVVKPGCPGIYKTIWMNQEFPSLRKTGLGAIRTVTGMYYARDAQGNIIANAPAFLREIDISSKGNGCSATRKDGTIVSKGRKLGAGREDTVKPDGSGKA